MTTRKHRSDLGIAFATLALMALGLIIIYAIGPMRANVLNNTYGTDYDPNYFFIGQFRSVLLSVVAFLAAFKFIPYKYIKKYAKPIINKRKGIDCEVRFYETDRCTEQFFLYYFSNTTKEFQSYEDLEKELHRYCEYGKRAHFFVRHPLHDFFKSKGGSLDDAIKNANASVVARDKGERDYSYSELGKMMEDIKECLE